MRFFLFLGVEEEGKDLRAFGAIEHKCEKSLDNGFKGFGTRLFYARVRNFRAKKYQI